MVAVVGVGVIVGGRVSAGIGGWGGRGCCWVMASVCGGCSCGGECRIWGLLFLGGVGAWGRMGHKTTVTFRFSTITSYPMAQRPAYPP